MVYLRKKLLNTSWSLQKMNISYFIITSFKKLLITEFYATYDQFLGAEIVA
jgi:hypothetical protein